MNTNTLNLFSVPVTVVREFLSKEESKELFLHVLNNETNFAHHGSLVGDSLSTHGSEKYFFSNPKASFLKKRVQDQLDVFSHVSGFAKSEIANSWVNIQNEGSILETHSHASSHLSGAIYLNVDDNSSKLYFFNPNQLLLYTSLDDKKFTPFNNSYIFLKPQIGDLIIFPSWLLHGSFRDVNYTKNRMVVSFNTAPISACSSVG
jgi:uncharacterized protein (TIGR02466 family)